MGALGSDAAIEAADIVLMTDEPSKIAAAIKIARKTLGIVRQNIILPLALKLPYWHWARWAMLPCGRLFLLMSAYPSLLFLKRRACAERKQIQNEQERVLAAQNTIHAAAEAA